MITKELLLEAIKTAHKNCLEDCIHTDAIEANMKAIEEEIGRCVVYALNNQISSAVMVFSMALHTGYRLHQLESEPAPKETVN